MNLCFYILFCCCCFSVFFKGWMNYLWNHVYIGNESSVNIQGSRDVGSLSILNFNRYLWFLLFVLFCFSSVLNFYLYIFYSNSNFSSNPLAQIQNQLEIFYIMAIWDFEIFVLLRLSEISEPVGCFCSDLLLNDITFSSILSKIIFYFMQ